MARSLTANVLTAIDKTVIYPILLIKINTSGGFVRYWTGYGTLVFNSEDYLGVGKAIGISDVRETGDLRANGLTISLSGVNQDFISIAIDQLQQGLEAIAFIAFFDNSTKLLLDDPYEIFTGITDIPIISEGKDTAIIGVKCENRLVALNIPKIRKYTKEDQRIDFPNDLGFDFVPGLQDKPVIFGTRGNDAANAEMENQ